MDKPEAHSILSQQLAAYRTQSYAMLAALAKADRSETSEVVAPSGNRYQLEIGFLWDNQPGGDVRVMGSIDGGGLDAFVPTTESFILSPEGRFVGECDVKRPSGAVTIKR